MSRFQTDLLPDAPELRCGWCWQLFSFVGSEELVRCRTCAWTFHAEHQAEFSACPGCQGPFEFDAVDSGEDREVLPALPQGEGGAGSTKLRVAALSAFALLGLGYLGWPYWNRIHAAKKGGAGPGSEAIAEPERRPSEEAKGPPPLPSTPVQAAQALTYLELSLDSGRRWRRSLAELELQRLELHDFQQLDRIQPGRLEGMGEQIRAAIEVEEASLARALESFQRALIALAGTDEDSWAIAFSTLRSRSQPSPGAVDMRQAAAIEALLPGLAQALQGSETDAELVPALLPKPIE